MDAAVTVTNLLCFVHEGGAGRIILSDGGGIRRNVIVVQKPSTAAVDKMTGATTPASSVMPESGVSAVDESATPMSGDVPGITASVTSLSPTKGLMSAFEQVRHSVRMLEYVSSCYPRESFASRGLCNHRRTFVCPAVCLSVTTITK